MGAEGGGGLLAISGCERSRADKGRGLLAMSGCERMTGNVSL